MMEGGIARIAGINDSFRAFIIGNNILTVMAAVTIAFSTGTMIRSLVGDIIMPSVYVLFASKVPVLSGAFAPINTMNIDNFVKEFVSWCFVILITFLLVEYVIRRWYMKHPSIISTKTDVDISSMIDVVEGFRCGVANTQQCIPHDATRRHTTSNNFRRI
jgi:large-conductance mechanosensitive channel